MTFRPSDDVLDQIASSQEANNPMNHYNTDNQGDGQRIFNAPENQGSEENVQDGGINLLIMDAPAEEVKAPDLSELLKDSGDNSVSNRLNDEKNVEQTVKVNDLENPVSNVVENQESQNIQNKLEGEDNSLLQKLGEDTTQQEIEDPLGKISDNERTKLVSNLEGSISSKLDLLIDEEWVKVVERYKIIYRFFLRWGLFTIISIIGIVCGVFLQVKAGNVSNLDMIDDSKIVNKSKWIEDTSDKKLLSLSESGVDIETLVPYGSLVIDGKTINSKSNLIKYMGIVLPQLISLNLDSDNFVSLSDFNEKSLGRTDIENIIKILITNNSNYRKTTNLPNASDSRWEGNTFGGGLEEGFNLRCLDNNKVSDIVCDRFLDVFYAYGKYYDLFKYSSELLSLFRKIKKQGKKIEPVCSMVKDYTLRAGVTSDGLSSLMMECGADDYSYYKKLTNFIDLENSLGQPEISDRVFDDPDLNAYKLLSAQQGVFKVLDGTSLNENYIKSYLNYVQALLDKDKGTNRYLHSIYKDILYVFNMDEIYQKLMQKGKLSTDLKLKIDQINNGNILDRDSISLLSQLTVPDIIQIESDFTGMDIEEKTIEKLFEQYYAMTDRLKIRKVTVVSGNEIKVQTELFTDKIMSASNGETLKVTAVLKKSDSLLYVKSIKIANQPKFSDILGIYASEGNVTFYAMLNYIDEQVGMWYELKSEELEEAPTFCEEVAERQDVSIYSCDDSAISLYKGEIEYNFVLDKGVLKSFTISDENLNTIVNDKLKGLMFMDDDTPAIITSILDFSIESSDDNIEKKLEIINQFRIHFKLVPNDIRDIEGETGTFFIDFTLGEFELQGYYDVDAHLLTKIAFTQCDEPLEIKKLSLEITAENESQLLEILNNPKVFFAKVNPAAYKKYQKSCVGGTTSVNTGL